MFCSNDLANKREGFRQAWEAFTKEFETTLLKSKTPNADRNTFAPIKAKLQQFLINFQNSHAFSQELQIFQHSILGKHLCSLNPKLSTLLITLINNAPLTEQVQSKPNKTPGVKVVSPYSPGIPDSHYTASSQLKTSEKRISFCMERTPATLTFFANHPNFLTWLEGMDDRLHQSATNRPK